jgi:general secretion pathway protein B
LSYILDALKKADAERENTAVPGLHAHPQDGPVGPGLRAGAGPWPALAIAAIVLLAAVLAWVLWFDRGVRTPPLVAEAPPPPSQPPAQAAAPVAAPVTVPTPDPAPAAVAAPAPAPLAPLATAAAPPPPPAAPQRVIKVPSQTPVLTPLATVRPPAPKASESVEPRLAKLSELPADVRASVPPLTISGAVYSPTPSARMLFINGQVMREGQTLAAGVVVESIGASASVLSARGKRFVVNH